MTQDSTMALGADFISDIFETPNTLAHKGVKGMKWGKHKAQTPTTAPASTIGELVNKYNETPEEMKARKAMVDEYLKTKGKDSGTKKAGGKGGGKGGGGKKGGAKKGSKKPAGSGGSGGSRASSNNAPAKTYEPRKNSYAPRKAIADILASVPKNLGPKAPKASVQAIIDKINASVDARKALQHELISNSEDLETIEGLLAHYGVLGMKWGVRKDDIPKGLGASGGGQIDEEDLLLAELMAKGLTADEIKKKIEDTLGKVNRTIEDIQYEIDKFEEHAVYPWEDVNQRVERQNNARNRRIEYDRRRDAEAKAEKDKQKAEDDAHGGRIYYDPMGFPTSPDDPFGRPALRGAKHSSIEGGKMSNGDSEFTGLDTMDKILAHYGILGMKWGVRNDDRGSGRPQGGPSKKKAPLASVKKMLGRSNTSDEATKSFEVETKGQKVDISYNSNKIIVDPNGRVKKANDNVTDEEFHAEVAKVNGQLTAFSAKTGVNIPTFKWNNSPDEGTESSSTKILATEKFVNPRTGKKFTITYDTSKLKIEADGKWTAADEKTAEDFRALLKQNDIRDVDLNSSIKITAQPDPEPKPPKRSDGGMSDEDLRSAINRLQMEKTYKQLVAERDAPPKKPQSLIKKILADSARAAAGELLKSTAVATGKYVMASALRKAGHTEYADVILKEPKDKEKEKAKAATP